MDKQDVVCTDIGILFSIKRNEVLTCTIAWMDLRNTMPIERIQTKKSQCVIPLIKNVQSR